MCAGTTMPIAPPKNSVRNRKPATASPNAKVASTMYTPRVRKTGNEIKKPIRPAISIAAGIVSHTGSPATLDSQPAPYAPMAWKPAPPRLICPAAAGTKMP